MWTATHLELCTLPRAAFNTKQCNYRTIETVVTIRFSVFTEQELDTVASVDLVETNYNNMNQDLLNMDSNQLKCSSAAGTCHM